MAGSLTLALVCLPALPTTVAPVNIRDDRILAQEIAGRIKRLKLNGRDLGFLVQGGVVFVTR